ncbi:MAG: ATP-binding protein [Proteocatella sp.]
MSKREELHLTKPYEQSSLQALINNLFLNSIKVTALNGFYFSFTISQISKEFDLLKIAKDQSFILNIELKSDDIPLEKIQKQLIQNQHYLQHISQNIASYTYISSTNKLYYLDKEKNLQPADFSSLIESINNLEDFLTIDLNLLFKVSDYLVSPINHTDKFINHQYFLTSQQEEISCNILQSIYSKTATKFIGLTGFAGTGKTLLLYNIARECTMHGKVCIIHCGILSDGHISLSQKIDNLDIYPIKNLRNDVPLDSYDFIFVDETQRIYTTQFNHLIAIINKSKKYCILSFDSNQVLSKSEVRNNICEKIKKLTPKIYTLSKKIRTNKELSSFMKILFNHKAINSNDHYLYNNINVIWANSPKEAHLIIENYKNAHYTFINYTSSTYKHSPFDIFADINDSNTHKVLGQEFDNVLVLLDNSFFYNDEKVLCTCTHPNPDYLYHKLLFQAVTRTRQKLCIIVINNKKLFEDILSIKINAISHI